MRVPLRILLCVFVFSLMPSVCFASLRSEVGSGNRYYKKGDYASAIESYRKALNARPDSDIINFDLGTALYQSGDYDRAVEHLEKALLTDQKSLQASALFNLGNAFYKQGILKEDKDAGSAVAFLEKSVASFEKVVDLDPKDSDAKHNLDFAKKELERLKKKQKEQQNKSCPLPKDQKQSSEEKKDDPSQSQQPKDGSSQDNSKQPQSSPQDQGSDKKDQSQEQQKQQDQQQKQEQQEQSEEKQAQDEKEKKQQEASGAGSTEEKKQGSSAEQQSSGAQSEKKEMSKDQAQRVLNNYEQQEQPKGFLYLLKQRSNDNSVDKDW